MGEKNFKRIERRATAPERERHGSIRKAVMQEFPPAPQGSLPPSPPGIPTQIRQARETLGLTWYALAKRAGVASADVIREIEHGQDAPLGTVQAVAKALGLRLELVQERV